VTTKNKRKRAAKKSRRESFLIDSDMIEFKEKREREEKSTGSSFNVETTLNK
jgi:hypothetical protein